MMMYLFLIAGLLFFSWWYILEQQQEREPNVFLGDIFEEKKRIKREAEALSILILFFFWFLTAFRAFEIGNDTKSYVNIFNLIASGKTVTNIEKGYHFFCFLISRINSNPVFLFVVCATICYGGLAIYILQYSKNLPFSIILGFSLLFGFFNSGLRQSLAMVICLFAYQLIKNRKYILAVIFIALASTFHLSAWICVLFLFHKIYPYHWIVVCLLACFIIISAVTGALDNLLKILLETFFQEYERYFSSEYFNNGRLANTYYAFRHIVFYLIVYKSYSGTKKSHTLELSCFFLWLLIGAGGFIISIFVRVTEYFSLIAVVELPNAIENANWKHKNKLIVLIEIIMLAYFLTTLILRPEWNYLYPYRFYWN